MSMREGTMGRVGGGGKSRGRGKRSKRDSGLLPESAVLFLKKRALELVGLALLLAGPALLVACLSYNPGDPSLNSASAAPVANLLGLPGAYATDLLLQSLGLASGGLALILSAWGYRLLRDKAIEALLLRLALSPVSLLLLAMGLEALPTPDGWPFPAGLGGFSGALLVSTLGGQFGLSLWILSGLGLVAGVALLVYGFALTKRDWRGLGQGMAWFFPRRSTDKAEPRRREDPKARRAAKDEAEDETSGLRVPAFLTDMKAPRVPSIPFGGLVARLRESFAKSPDEEDEELTGQTGGPRVEPTLGASRVERRQNEPDPDPVEIPAAPKRDRAQRGAARKTPPKQTSLALGNPDDYAAPPLDYLRAPPPEVVSSELSEDALEKNARLLEGVLQDFGVKGEIVKVRPGPVVTRYELEPAPGTKTSRVIGLADDIARSMSALSVRVAVVPGSSVIGIELPNKKRDTVWLREVLSSDVYQDGRQKLPLVLGKDISGAPSVADLSRMPHLLVAGTTGSGKSVSINAMILSLLYRLSPEQCRFIMVDPKMLELSVYDGIPHLLSPVVTDPRKAVVALKWAVREMEQRYQAMSRLGVRSIEGYNQRVEEARKKGEVLTRKVQTGFDPDTGQPIYEEQPFDLASLPFIVVIVDEMADLMLVAGKDVEGAIQRLAQMARAAGIHLIMATQRPSVDVITGTIKANFPTRISFHVTSKIDSRTILGEMGAEQLLGMGDMLHMAHGGRISRVHGPLVTDEEVEKVVNHLRSLGEPEYLEDVTEDEESLGDPLIPGGDGGSGDDLYDQAVALVLRERKASTSFVQRHLQIGYNRAARLIERMEQEGLVSQANHVGKREILAGGGE
jgi:S-DNA-T family DNA segregation ATPase FtsK/SpoIIIE